MLFGESGQELALYRLAFELMKEVREFRWEGPLFTALPPAGSVPAEAGHLLWMPEGQMTWAVRITAPTNNQARVITGDTPQLAIARAAAYLRSKIPEPNISADAAMTLKTLSRN